ncbi:hypothetical protein [Streptomyces tauricus]
MPTRRVAPAVGRFAGDVDAVFPDGQDEARALQQKLQQQRQIDGTWNLTIKTGGSDETAEPCPAWPRP